MAAVDLTAFARPLETTTELVLDGESLSIAEVVAVARYRRRVQLAPAAKRRIVRSRAVVDVLLEQQRVVYGLTTGFGKLRDKVIPPEQTAQLQKNLLRSHAVGRGRAFAEDVVRAATLLRANTLCRGNSGVRLEVVEALVAMLNDDIYPYVPEKGSLGASGDLAPLSHLALVLIGDPGGRIYPGQARAVRGATTRLSAREQGKPLVTEPRDADFEALPPVEDQAAWETLARREGWQRFRPVDLAAKEGLALNNGTQFMCALGCLAVSDAFALLRSAELATAMSLEAISGVLDAFDVRLHVARPQRFQREVAERIAGYCGESQIIGVTVNSARLFRAHDLVEDALRQLEAAEGPHEADMAALAELRDALAAWLEDRYESVPTFRELQRLPAAQQIQRLSPWVATLRGTALASLSALLKIPEPSATLLKARERLDAAAEELGQVVPTVPPVQDDYSFRCTPQVLGGAWHAWERAAEVVATEINSSNDNPLLFPPTPPEEELQEPAAPSATDAELHRYREAYAAWLREGHLEEASRSVISGGNFHGEPLAFAYDYLAMAMAELGNLSERRTAHLVDPAVSNGLPAFLVRDSGVNTGLMIPQYTAAALVSENKVLAHPASVDSIPSSANAEDHVSMGLLAARKAAEVVRNVRTILAIEVLTAYQGLQFRRPLAPGRTVCDAIALFEEAGLAPYTEDRVLYPDMQCIEQVLTEPTLQALLATT